MNDHSKRVANGNVWLVFLMGIVLLCGKTVIAEEFQYPLAVVVDKQETIFVADLKLPGIWKISEGKKEIFFQASKKFRTPLNAVRCLALDKDGNLLAGDSSTREVYRFSAEGKPTPLTKGKVGIAMALAVNSKGDIYVADLETRSILIIPSEGGSPKVFVTGLPVRGMTFDQQGNLLVAAHSKNQLLQITPEKKIEVLIPGRPFQFSHHLTIDEDGNRYIADGYVKTIWKVSPSEKETKPIAFIADEVLKNPVGLTWHKNLLYVADPRSQSIFIFDQTGKLKSKIPEK